MPYQVDYLPVATGGGANVDTQSTFAGSAYQVSGFVGGTAFPNQANKVWRQSSMIAAAIASWISTTLAENVLDDGNLAGLVTLFTSAINAAVSAGGSGAAAQISTLQSELNTADTNITALQNEVNTDHTSITTLQGLVSALQNPSSLVSANGYYTLPGGFLVQWASGSSVNGRGQTSLSWPKPFPNAFFGATVTVAFDSTVSSANNQGTAFYVQPSSTLSTLQLQYDVRPDGSADSTYHPFAIGIGY